MKLKGPIGVAAAAGLAGVSPDKVSAAMSEGKLRWKRFRGQRATTQAWVVDWLNDQEEDQLETPGLAALAVGRMD
jgi:hypothetical protein